MRNIEMPQRYGYLNSDGFLDTEVIDAAKKRALDRNTARLAGRGQKFFHFIGNSSLAVADLENANGRWRGFGSPDWSLVHSPIKRFKKPLLKNMSMRIRARIQDSYSFQLQLCTSVMPFNPRATATDPNVLTMTGDGDNDFDLYELLNVPCSEQHFEKIEIWIRGGLTETLLDEATYGINNAGTCTQGSAGYTGMHDSSSLWNDVDRGGHYLEVENVPGQYVVMETHSQTELRVHRPFVSSPMNRDYAIYELAEYIIGSCAVYLEDLEFNPARSRVMSYGEIYMSAPAATNVAAAGTFLKALGTTTLGENRSFDMPTNNRLRYTGSAPRKFLITCVLSASVANAGRLVSYRLAVLGANQSKTEIQDEHPVINIEQPATVTLIRTLNQNEYVELFLTADGTGNVTINRMVLSAVEIVE